MNKMKNIIALLTLIACACLSISYAGSDSENLTEEQNSRLEEELQTILDRVIWLGAGAPCEFQLRKLSEKQKQDYEAKGVRLLEDGSGDGNELAMSWLSSYHYYHTKCYKKAIFWAHKSACKGDVDGMRILAVAHWTGLGVIEDLEEGLKWAIIMTVMGDELAIETVNRIKKDHPDHYKAALISAREWMKEHFELFYSP